MPMVLLDANRLTLAAMLLMVLVITANELLARFITLLVKLQLPIFYLPNCKQQSPGPKIGRSHSFFLIFYLHVHNIRGLLSTSWDHLQIY